MAALARGVLVVAAAVAAALLAVAAPLAGEPVDSNPRVLVAEFENDVNPVTQDFLVDAIDRAEDEGYNAVVIEMDTPGGLSSSMRAIVKRILAAEVPVIVYVAPPGASADSAGAVIGMAADVLAMAPQTNIGSSTPVSIGGEDISRDLRRKIVNDAAAYIGELAREHGRNVQVAREMVTKATNLGAREALEKNVIDVIATDYPDLFGQIDGMTTEPKGLTISAPPGTQVERVELSMWKSLLDLLIDPNIIALMLSIGLIGIVVELWNPGLVFPGTVGAISLIVGLYGLQVLPISAAGLLLMVLAAAFFVAEAFIVSHGALAVAGAVMFTIGALMLFDPAGDAYQVSLPVALAIAGTLALLFGLALTKAAQVRRVPVAVGSHRLVGEPAAVRGESLVFVDGELWHARSADGSPLVAGEQMLVEGVEPDTLELVVGSPKDAPTLQAERT
ncbi:MAG TPA: nodulation protein NfeD [Gaiellaceae bacterium]|nr:nodulation protein NfeD [Gaiellaceae bacterium]